MTVTHNGDVATDADTAADFTNNNSGANISGDDDNVEGTGAVGDKMSGTNELLVSDALAGGASGVYDFSSGGADEGEHIIGWFNTKTPIDATDGLQIMVRNASGHEGSWYVLPTVFYKGGFITKVIDPERDFDTATTWTTNGNPAQLDDVSELGGEFNMTTTIMGNFNNSQVDQFSVGFGLRCASNQFTFDTTSGVNSGNDTIAATAHGWPAGTPVFYSKAGGSVDIGLTDGTIYYTNPDGVNTVTMHATRAAAIADTGAINLTATGSETHEITPAYAFEDLRVFDEDTNFHGWWSSTQGAFVGKGGAFIGPASGNAESRFNDNAFTVIFADELVATGFYKFDLIGTDTLVEWQLASIASANPDNANNRWDIVISATFGDTAGFGFTDENGVWKQGGQLTLNSSCALTNTTMIDCDNLFLGDGATMDGCTILDANTTTNEAFIETADLTDITDCSFTASLGHAIEITDGTGTPFTFTGNEFNDYGGTPGSNLVENTGDSSAAILNSSGSAIEISITGGGDTPSIRNTGSGSTTTVTNNTQVTLTGLVNPTEVRVYEDGTETELAGQENVTTGTFIFSQPASDVVDIRIFAVQYLPADILQFTIPSLDTSIPVQQIFDRNYENP